MSIKTKILKIVIDKEIENYLQISVKALLHTTAAAVVECSEDEIKLLAKMGKRVYASLGNNPEIKDIVAELVDAISATEKVINGDDRITESDLE